MNVNDNFFYLPRSFQRDPSYNFPPERELKFCTNHPELNSADYVYQAFANHRQPYDFLPFYCLLDVKEDVFVVGTNNFNVEIFDGNFIGTENFESIIKHDISQTVFQIPEQSTVTCLKYLKSNLFIAATKNCTMQLWSSKCAFRDAYKYSPFKCGEVTTDGFTANAEQLQQASKLIVGTNKGHMDLFDFGLSDLTVDSHIAYAHSKAITGISAHPTNKKFYASCSIDRNCLLWDTSKARRTFCLLRNHKFQITAVHWTTQEENKQLVMIGDEVGNVLTLDPRKPNEILNIKRVANREISKFAFNGSKNFGVVARSNIAKILKVEACGGVELVHEHVAPGIVYAMCSDEKDKNLFYVAGERKYAAKISL